MEFVLRDTMFIDVGASVGDFSVAGSRRVGSRGIVLALEPNADVFRELMSATWGTRVAALNLAASSESGWAMLQVPRDRRGVSRDALGSLEQREAHDIAQQRTRTIRLDDLVGDNWPVSAIKIDVEGHELAVLQGAELTISRHRPALMIEIEERHCVHHGVHDVVDWIVSRGYTVNALDGDNLMAWADFHVTVNQTRWLDDRVPSGVKDGAPYINNFLCTPNDQD